MTLIKEETATGTMMVIDGLELSNWDRDFLLELQKGGVTCVHACCGLWENARETLSKVSEWYRFFREHDDLVLPVKRGEDIRKAQDEGKIGIILGTQNTSALEDELGLVEVFEQLGIKIMQLTYNNQNLIGSSCYEENDAGLSRYGKLIVEEMNRVGMVIDLSHVGEQTSLDAIRHSERPVAITHANPDWIYPSRRNKSREVLQALKDNGGVLGLCAYPHLINGPETSIDEFVDLIVETIDFMGVEHVAIGTDLTLNMSDDFLHWMRMGRWTHDMDYGAGSKSNPSWPTWPSWFKGPADFPNISDALLDRGVSREDVASVMGGNWYRFFDESFRRQKEM
ncbi:peptidase M19 [Salimicrobium jeotgali]|uniref:M19 family peptidase n=2 Tax=Salimicrobium TaxID=351195 RepID=K2H4C3_9BACI|nr:MULTISPECIES: membrane dipeptidase [Salimicrobium]AKG03443.1 peptidase M19 [Salimicrobium jeotgali]EKE30720.1 M19 family peptidase [Salimicrobium jeotgali]MBM7697151.1 microsomal dipeptidase-like Zn-dependent dipeptidase [Salimicrobium jeotgali]PBB06912.1 peptidase M19 [Salimicrobium humidisoli]